jgi:hypothetical protein
LVFLGYLSIKQNFIDFDNRVPINALPRYSPAVVLLFVGLAWVFLFNTAITSEGFRPFHGNEQNEARVGSGPFFMFQDLFLYAFIAYIAAVPGQHQANSKHPWLKWIVILTIITSLVMTVAIASRRLITTIIFALVVSYILRRRRGTVLAILVIAGSVIAASLLDAFRYIDITALDGSLQSIANAFSSSFGSRRFWTSLSSSFEGVDHLAAFIEKAGAEGLLIGVDRGVAWIYNAFLGLVPRAIWGTKPELYGSVAEQFFLYPWMYVNGPAQATFPSGFVVDFTFGFGMAVGLFLAFFLGRMLKVLSVQLWSPHSNIAIRIIPLFVFVNLFNVVRGGTGFLQSLIILIIVASFVIGFRPMISELMHLLRLVLLPNMSIGRK